MTTCDCVESCAIADRFTPATRELMVFTKSAKRYFDLDAVREPLVRPHEKMRRLGVQNGGFPSSGNRIGDYDAAAQSSGAPPLDWWKIDPDIPYTPQYEGEQMPATFYVGDAIEVMGKLPENSVDLILTSPPFLALRSYLPADHPDKGKEGGSQATPGEFIDWLLDVAEACDRVLAPHGSLCIELGDTYCGGGGTWGDSDPKRPGGFGTPVGGRSGTGWPLAKSLSLIPESFRFAMVYGFNPHTGRTTEPWRLRNVIRWVRPNPPVGALGDKFRPATSELMVFCKSAKRYFDLDAVRTPSELPSNYGTGTMHDHANDSEQGRTQLKRVGGRVANAAGAPPLDWWNIPLLEGEEETRYGPKEKALEAPKVRVHARTTEDRSDRNDWNAERLTHNPLGAPPLDWWEIPPGGYSGAHYACWPEELCIKPIKAMCPPGGLVLDCFGGSGTTAAVATGHGRNCVLIDLDERNFQLALDRVGPWLLEGPYRLDDLASGQLPPGWPDDARTRADVPADDPPVRSL